MFRQLLDQGREIIIDNWNILLELVEFLFTKNCFVPGTIRTNRGVPKELTENRLNIYQNCFVRKHGILLLPHKDKREVYVLASKDSAGFVEKRRYQSMV